MVDGLKSRAHAVVTSAVRRGMPPAWSGYRAVRRETVRGHFERRGWSSAAGRLETVHEPAVARNPLPANVAGAAELPDDAGWWGYSFRDVPARPSGETFVATLPECRVVWYLDEALGGDFHPAVLTSDDRALDLREVRFRPRHGEVLRRSPDPVRLERATWILERVYHNHSHWLTAHLPKLALLRDRGELDDVLLPVERSPAIDGSIRLLGLDPGSFPTFDPARPLQVGELTLVGSDRFRPELLQLVQGAAVPPGAAAAHRRVYVSRAKASRRRLVNEDQLEPVLARHGFERVAMEELSFTEQVDLMRETAVLCGPHGAGLTNMIFCPPGAHVVEIADLSFPNPNFYALASGLRHRYWLLTAQGLGGGHPLERDLRIDVAAVDDVLAEVVAR